MDAFIIVKSHEEALLEIITRHGLPAISRPIHGLAVPKHSVRWCEHSRYWAMSLHNSDGSSCVVAGDWATGEQYPPAFMTRRVAAHDTATRRAGLLYPHSRQAGYDHPYLQRKGLTQLMTRSGLLFGFRVSNCKFKNLLAPYTDIDTEQLIWEERIGIGFRRACGEKGVGVYQINRQKFFGGCFICEGVATAITIACCTGGYVIASGGRGRLPLAVREASRICSCIVVCLDLDSPEEARQTADACRLAYGAVQLCIPCIDQYTDREPERGYDMNDLLLEYGEQAVVYSTQHLIQ